ncbi:M15 family metallopeptidase [Vaginella massiliensis]|uniref:M15 family metallopeptidase n=1 Tax=Vaginella massiliensis TaxID=1816680 RepID=UPI000837D452|nr:M15 family metallopeptidase [Vaginella massiliensis]
MIVKFPIKHFLLASGLSIFSPSCAQKQPNNENEIEVDETQQTNAEKVRQFSDEELLGKANPTMKGKDYHLLPEVADAFEAMRAEAKKAGFNIRVVSSYRNFTYQKGIWERKFKANKNRGLSTEENIRKIIEYSTIPGTSRHHWGTDLDIIDISKGYPKDPLHEKHFNAGGQMHAFKVWLDENAEKFGFYLVYTNDENRKGFKYEPWHFSYKKISQPMLQEYLTLDITNLLKKNKLSGSDAFDELFIQQYINDNILDINPSLK